MAAGDGDLDFYPAYCFKESPTHFTWVKMAAVDVHRLKRRQGFDPNIFFYLNHPVRFVCVVGLIVARTDVYRRTILTLDDSSGATIDVAVQKSGVQNQDQSQGQGQAKSESTEGDHVTTTSQDPIDIESLTAGTGTVVKIKGTLSTFRAQTQLQLERFFLIGDTTAEMHFLAQRTRVLVEVLSVPWELSSDEVAALHRQSQVQETRAAREHEAVRRRYRRRIEREERDQRRILRAWEREEGDRAREAGVCRDAGRRVMRERG